VLIGSSEVRFMIFISAGARGSRQDDRLDSSKLMTSSGYGDRASLGGMMHRTMKPLAMRNLNRGAKKIQLAELLDEYMTATRIQVTATVQSVTAVVP